MKFQVTLWRRGEVIKYRITLNQSLILKKIISHEPQNIFLHHLTLSLHHLKDLSLCDISFTDMTPIWPLLLVETRSWIFQKIISHEPQNIIFTIFTSFYRSIIILHFIHRHDPNLTSPSGRKRAVHKLPFRAYTQRAVRGIVLCTLCTAYFVYVYLYRICTQKPNRLS